LKFQHLAIFAFAGWYLIVPPTTQPSADAYKQPYSSWQIVRGFDEADDCEKFKNNFTGSSREKAASGSLEPAYRDYMFAQCLASNDPRLFYPHH